ncbi:YCF48-related protein [Cytophagaceae bacterium ABcell3]|nr:YCF48-related protein [Cytophagaceae bacterium ABcell3]
MKNLHRLRGCYLLILCFLAIGLNKANAQDDWKWVKPLPQGNSLFNTHAINENLVYVCGANGVVLKTSDAGDSWEILNTGAPSTLYSIHFVNPDTGYVAGTGGYVLRTKDGGQSWSLINDGISDFTGVHNGLYFIDKNTGFLSSGVGGEKYLFKTEDGGDNWTELHKSPGVTFRKFSFIDNNTGYVFAQEPVGLTPSIFKTTDGGTTWDSLSTITDTRHVYDIHFVSENTGFATGFNGEFTGNIMKTTDGGVSWEEIATKPAFVQSLYFTDADNGYVVADDIYVTADGGDNWEALSVEGSSTSGGALRGAEGNIWLVGPSNSAIFKGTASNNNFERISSGHIPGELLSIDGHQDEMVAVGRRGHIYHSNDHGKEWQRVAKDLTENHLMDVSFPDQEIAVAVGRNGTIVIKEKNKDWEGIDTEIDFNLNAVCIKDGHHGFIAADSGRILYTHDNFKNWNLKLIDQEKRNFHSIHFLNGHHGFAAGEMGVLMATKDGQDWDILDAGVINDLFSMYFMDDDNGIITGSNGMILRTEDGGETWGTVTSGTEQDLRSVYFADESHGWISGIGGTLLKTTDGGRTWEDDEKLTSNAITALYFKDKSQGWAVGAGSGANPYRTMPPAGFGSILQYKTTSQDNGTLSVLQEAEEQKINVYPIPAEEYLTFSFEGQPGQQVTIEIFEASGKKVEVAYQGETKNNQNLVTWNLNGKLKPGIYLYNIRTGQDTQTGRFIVK